MNTSAPEPLDQPLTPWLMAYDLAMAAASGRASEPIPPDLANHVEQIQSCLRLLDDVWPASTRGSTGLDGATPTEDMYAAGSTPVMTVPGFEIQSEIARGGMGIIYKARQHSLDRVVAIKCLPPHFAQDPNRLARFRREARAAARLATNGILPIHDVLEAGGVPVLVMPYIDGSDLARIIADRQAIRQGQSPARLHRWALLSDAEYLDRVLPVLDKAVDALTFLHRADIVHRDIKPSNILVDRDSHAWLSDFGLARLGQQDGLTVMGQGVGTPGYMSPEQWSGDGNVDGRADVFSMGVTLYQALTLTLPYGRERIAHDSRLPAPPTVHQPRLPPDMDAVILRALAPDLRDRYRSAEELQEDWTRVRKGTPPLQKAPRNWRRVLRQRWPMLTAAAAVLVAFLVTIWFMSAGGPQSQAPAEPVLRTVTINTDPPGADIVFVPLDPEYGEPEAANAVRPPDGQTTPCKLKLVPGRYFVEADIPGRGFHQVYRYVPSSDQHMGDHDQNYLRRYPQEWWSDSADGAAELATIHVPNAAEVTHSMARLPGGDFWMGTNLPEPAEARPQHVVSIPPYYLDTKEVTEKDYRALQENFKMQQKLPASLTFEPRGDRFPVTKIEYRPESI